MDDRRADLRLRWKDVAARAGLTTEGLLGVRKGTGEIRPLTKRGIEDALDWEAGSIDAILAGGEPAVRGRQMQIEQAEADVRNAKQYAHNAEGAEDDPRMQRAMELLAEATAVLEQIRAERRKGA